MSSTISIFCILVLAIPAFCSAFPHRFRFIPHQKRDGYEDAKMSSFDQLQRRHHTKDNATICANFTHQFLKQLISNRYSAMDFGKTSDLPLVFGWITAQGSFPLNNKTEMAVKCLALAMSSRDLVVERKCIRTILPAIGGNHNHSNVNLTIDWPHAGKENFTWVDDGYGQQEANDSRSSPVILLQLPNIPRHSHHHVNSFPCIFPIDDRLADHLAWNGTVCGISRVFTDGTDMERHWNVSCHPIEFTFNGTAITDEELFSPHSSLFLFNADGLLSAVGGYSSVGPSFQAFNKDNCLSLSNSTEGRVKCSSMVNGPTAEMMDSLIDLAQNVTTQFPTPEPTIQNSSAVESLAMVPLLVLSVLVISGMLLTIAYFIVQKHRHIYYDTI